MRSRTINLIAVMDDDEPGHKLYLTKKQRHDT
jgi:hypothetical protein